MTERAEVAIVGAGPAGSTLALQLARAGIDTLLLDRAHFPRDKPCGDCLSAAAGRLLAELGLLERVRALAPAQLRGWRIIAPGGASFSADFAELGDDPDTQCALAVPRHLLDKVLLEAAVEAGARVRFGARVHGVTQGDGAVRGVVARVGDEPLDVSARVTVGADGLRSRVARELHAIARPPRLRKLSLTTHVPLTRDLHERGEMHCAGTLCIGIAPVAADGSLCNVTLVADSTVHGRAAARDPHAFFRQALGCFPELRELDLPPGELLASGPFDSPTRRIAFDGAVLVGDAAGYFDPFTGQGVYQAMAAARALAPTLMRALERPGTVPAAAFAHYVREHRRLTRGARRVQRVIDVVLARTLLADAAIAAIARRAPIARTLLAVTGDLRPARALLAPRLALALPFPRTAGHL